MGLHNIYLRSNTLNKLAYLLMTSTIICCPVGSDADDLNRNFLKDKRDSLDVIYELLSKSRLDVDKANKSLSVFIDSLKRKNIISAELNDALRESVSLETQMSEVDTKIEQIIATRDSNLERLLLAYDWDISRLYKMWSDTRDPGLYTQWMILKEERQELSPSIIEPMQKQYSVEMTIVSTDGPDQIRQKIESAEAHVGNLRKEIKKVQNRIDLLERREHQEYIMKGWVREFRREGHIVHGDSFQSKSGKLGKRKPSFNSTHNEQSLSEGRPPAKVRRRGEIRERKFFVPVPVSRQEYDRKLNRFRDRLKELREIEALLVGRIDTFLFKRKELLDGPE